MTPAETAELLRETTLRCPGRPLPLDAGDVWLRDLAAVPLPAAVAAVRRWAAAGNAFPPGSDWVLADVGRHAQLPAPSAEDAQRVLARLIARCAPADGRSPADTEITVRRLAEHGVHEAILRWVQTAGVAAIRTMPDPSLFPLDPNQLADRRDRHRRYERDVIEDWRRDPRPGLALERAKQAALNAGGRRGLPAGSDVIELQEGDVVELPASVEQVSAFIEQGRRVIAEARFARNVSDAARRAEADREDAAVQAAERELAEHAARRRAAAEVSG